MVETKTATSAVPDYKLNSLELQSNGRGYYGDQASIISSAADVYETAPTTPVMVHKSLSSSSVNTVSGNNGPAEPRVDQTPKGRHSHSDQDWSRPGVINPLHALSQTGANEAHVIKVSGNRVVIEEGPRPEPLFRRALPSSVASVLPNSKKTSSIDSTGSTIANGEAGLPPSPPESTDPRELDSPTGSVTGSNSRSSHETSSYRPRKDSSERLPPIAQSISPSPTQPLTPPRSRIIHPSTDGEPVSPKPSSEASVTFVLGPQLHRASTVDERSHSLIQQPSSPLAGPSSKPSHQSADVYLSPPLITFTSSAGASTTGQPSSSRKPQRRNTFSTSATSARLSGDEPVPELDDDILALADQIRRERTTKRERAEREKSSLEAAAVLTRQRSWGTRKGLGLDEKPLVGNLIGEDHVNYVLMYNMLTGIRIAVSRCQGKPNRSLSEEDFTAKHKYSFDITGNELTPSARYDFKFKDYAPWVFRDLREEYFDVDPADYLLSLTAKYILSELGSPGKSGSFFYFSRDYRFIIKTIHHGEHKFLRSILKEYHAHVKDNPHTLLSRFYGLHRVKLPRGRKIHFVIMNNLFPPHKDIHETYDLKGSTVGREYPEDRAKDNPGAVLKDNNWLRRGRTLQLGPEKKAFLTEQLRRDTELLQRLNVMDYSLLVGIHELKRGNTDNVRRNTLKVFSPDMPQPRRRAGGHAKKSSLEASAMRRAMRGSAINPNKLNNVDAADLPPDLDDRKSFLFYSEDGGYRATDEQNHAMDSIYYFGIIDICTRYTVLKKLEHLWKGMSADSHKISPVPAMDYGKRFLRFLTGVMRGGDRSEFLPVDQEMVGKDKGKQKEGEGEEEGGQERIEEKPEERQAEKALPNEPEGQEVPAE